MSLPKIIRDNGLTIVLMLMFFVSIVGMWLAGWKVENEDLRRHGGTFLSLREYLFDPSFASSVFENWESEFLQMSMYVVLTSMLVQRGSSESKDPDAPPRDASSNVGSKDPTTFSALGGGPVNQWLYAHSLGLALFMLFVSSFVLHWRNSAKVAAQEARDHGEQAVSTLAYLGDPQLWFESFQNWQSEFLSTAVLVVLSILRSERSCARSAMGRTQPCDLDFRNGSDSDVRRECCKWEERKRSMLRRSNSLRIGRQ